MLPTGDSGRIHPARRRSFSDNTPMADQEQIPQLPAPAQSAPVRSLPIPFEAYRAAGRLPEAEAMDTSVPLSHYFWVLRCNWWRIALFVCCCTAAAYIISTRLVPIYESTATIDIDRQMPSGVIGQEATRTATNDSDQFLATQVRLIQSDSVLRPVARQWKLSDVELTSRKKAPGRQRGCREEAPVRLKNLRVTRPPNTYLLLISYRSPDRRLAADVANGIARSYLEHTYNIRFKSSAEPVRFHGAPVGRAQGEDGAVRRGPDAVRARAECDQPGRKDQYSFGSAAAVEHRVHQRAGGPGSQGSGFQVNVRRHLEAAQVSTQGDALKRLSEKLEEAEQKFAEVRSHYGPNHPEYRKAPCSWPS